MQQAEFNPACMVGAPLLLSAQESVMKVMHEGALLDVTHCQLLQALAEGLRCVARACFASIPTRLPALCSNRRCVAFSQCPLDMHQCVLPPCHLREVVLVSPLMLSCSANTAEERRSCLSAAPQLT